MPSHKALIFTEDGIARCQTPDFIELEHLNVGEISVVEINNGTITPQRTYTGAIPGITPPTTQIHTINGGSEGSILILRCQSATLIDNLGNLRLSGNFTMNNVTDTLMLIRTAQGTWLELSRSNNG